MMRILVVDDEPQILRALATNLRARDYEVDLAATGEEALTIAARKHPDLVIVDLGLPTIDGVEVIRGLRGWTEVPIIVLSGQRGTASIVRAIKLEAYDFVCKPFVDVDLEVEVGHHGDRLRRVRPDPVALDRPRLVEGRRRGGPAGHPGPGAASLE